MFLAAAALSIQGRPLKAQAPEELISHSQGGYWYLPGLSFFCFAVRAADGYEIVRATFQKLHPLSAGLETIGRLLREAGRPMNALCGLELRSARQVSPEEFGSFNATYLEAMAEAGLVVNDQVPLTRTNVTAAGVQEPSIHSFCYTMPIADRRAARSPTFVLAAIPEARNIKTQPEFVAAGDTTLEGLRLKTEFVLNAIDGIMLTLDAQWDDVTGVQLYTEHDLHPLLESLIVPWMGNVARRGIEWHHAQPPVFNNEIEIAVRGVRLELLSEV